MLRLPCLVTLLTVASLAGGCSSDGSEVLGTVTVGPYSVKVSREMDKPVANAMTDFVVKPLSGGMPTSVKGWVGTATRMDTDVITGVYDPDDGDYDHDLTMPSTVQADAMWVFVMDTNGSDATGMIGFQDE